MKFLNFNESERRNLKRQFVVFLVLVGETIRS